MTGHLVLRFRDLYSSDPRGGIFSSRHVLVDGRRTRAGVVDVSRRRRRLTGLACGRPGTCGYRGPVTMWTWSGVSARWHPSAYGASADRVCSSAAPARHRGRSCGLSRPRTRALCRGEEGERAGAENGRFVNGAFIPPMLLRAALYSLLMVLL